MQLSGAHLGGARRWAGNAESFEDERTDLRASSSSDSDGDGLSDAEEARIAREYLPHLSLHPRDRCPRAGIVYRLRPHPLAPGRLHLIAVLAFERDCGAMPHVGDNEALGVTIDPARPAPEGILAVRTIAHQGTLCQKDALCGACSGLKPCATIRRDGARYPLVLFSKDKHGAYLSARSCQGACFLTNWCEVDRRTLALPMVNAGEARAPATRDLTAAGLITVRAGWRQRGLFHYDPWGSAKFGGAARMSRDLNDPVFLTPACAEPRPVAASTAR